MKHVLTCRICKSTDLRIDQITGLIRCNSCWTMNIPEPKKQEDTDDAS